LSEQDALHKELKVLIVETLGLEDVTADEIDTDAALFVEGLGLDSIDSLEIAMVIEQQYGVTVAEDPETNREIFRSVRTLAAFVTENRVE
jgi:acyl carrier protein